MWLYLTQPYGNRKELQHIWQRDVRDHQSPTDMETLPRRKWTWGHNIVRSQECNIFLKTTESKPLTSTMGHVYHKVQYQVNACTWIQNGPIRRIIQMTRSRTRWGYGQWRSYLTTRQATSLRPMPTAWRLAIPLAQVTACWGQAP